MADIELNFLIIVFFLTRSLIMLYVIDRKLFDYFKDHYILAVYHIFLIWLALGTVLYDYERLWLHKLIYVFHWYLIPLGLTLMLDCVIHSIDRYILPHIKIKVYILWGLLTNDYSPLIAYLSHYERVFRKHRRDYLDQSYLLSIEPDDATLSILWRLNWSFFFFHLSLHLISDIVVLVASTLVSIAGSKSIGLVILK